MGAASVLYSSDQQPVYNPYKQQTTALRKNNSAIVSKPSGKFAGTRSRNIHGGPPPFQPLCYLQSASLYNYMLTQRHQYINKFGHQQPPLLPSPNIFTSHSSLASTKKTKAKKQKYVEKHDHYGLVISKGSSSGPYPNELPIEFPMVFSSLSPKANMGNNEFSGSVLFGTSPPPSSLPLPKFMVRRPKLACKAEAATAGDNIDGATDNLRRMLRL